MIRGVREPRFDCIFNLRCHCHDNTRLLGVNVSGLPTTWLHCARFYVRVHQAYHQCFPCHNLTTRLPIAGWSAGPPDTENAWEYIEYVSAATHKQVVRQHRRLSELTAPQPKGIQCYIAVQSFVFWRILCHSTKKTWGLGHRTSGVATDRLTELSNRVK
jgi:hypothetical protein